MAVSKSFAPLAWAQSTRRWIAKIYALLLMCVAIVALVDGVRWWCCWLSAPRPPTESASEPSPRNEIGITDINREYRAQGRLHVQVMGRGFAWLDTGTHTSLPEADSSSRSSSAGRA